jgi:uncharacterized protein YdbL (DUF1318 family)
MKPQIRIFNYLMLCLLLSMAAFLPMQSLTAQSTSSEAALIESMEARLPELIELKLDGTVGETNMGLVEARSTIGRDERRLIAQENTDRLAHYKLIADKLGLPVAAVQRKRAEQIRDNSPKGVWLESKNGDWYQK